MTSAATEQTSTRSISGASAAGPSGAVARTAGRSGGGESSQPARVT
jgi:hypothetical protein